jgi:hypothetical protein
MPGYTREQLDNIRAMKSTPEYKRASPRERKALFEATRVESNHRDLDYGDRDSLGILQQRNNGAWGAAKEDVATDSAQFLRAARKANTGRGSAGQLAQAVQRSAFPDRYDEHSAEADELVGSAPTNRTSTRGRIVAGSDPTLVPGTKTVDKRAAVQDALLNRKKGQTLAGAIVANVSSGDYTTETKPEVIPGEPSKFVKGKRSAASGTGESAQPGIAELFWNGPHAANIKDGKPVEKGFVSGHTDHVHLAADRATMKRAAKLAKSMGLRVGEYGKGITSGHVAGSNHYKPFGAMDVSGPKMAEFASRVASGDF